MPTFFISTFEMGIGSTSMPSKVNKRADALGQMLMPHGKQELLTGSLHDIYELNVLSPAHLQKEALSSQSLAQWINSGHLW
jgi:hypothetical protein